MNVTKISPAQQAVLDIIAAGGHVVSNREHLLAPWRTQVVNAGRTGILPSTIEALLSRGLIVAEKIDNRCRRYSLPVTEQPEAPVELTPAQQRGDVEITEYKGIALGGRVMADFATSKHPRGGHVYKHMTGTVESIVRCENTTFKSVWITVACEDGKSRRVEAERVGLASAVTEQPLPEQQQAEALPVTVADTMRAAQDAQQRAYKPSRRERMALAEAALEALDTEAAHALEAEHMARHAEEDAIARSLQVLDVALTDSTPVAPGSFVRSDYCATPGAQVAAWKSANRALRAVMAQAAMWEANRIKGAGKYLGLRNIFTFRQLVPQELHALRLAILGGYITQDWELADGDSEPAMAQRISNVDAEDFARIMG